MATKYIVFAKLNFCDFCACENILISIVRLQARTLFFVHVQICLKILISLNQDPC